VAVVVDRPLQLNSSRLGSDGHLISSSILDVSGMLPGVSNRIAHRLSAPIKSVVFMNGEAALDQSKGDADMAGGHKGWDLLFVYVVPQATSVRVVCEYGL
jgi:hypothetical protein